MAGCSPRTSSPPPCRTLPPARPTAASGPSPGGTSGSTTWTPHEATAESGSTNQRHPSTPDASTPNGTRTLVQLERVTVTGLLHELEGCEPDAESASLSSRLAVRGRHRPRHGRGPGRPGRHQRGRPRSGRPARLFPEPTRNQLGL